MLRIAYITKNIVYPRKNAKAFHNGSNSDYYFIIKEIGEEFETLKNT